MTKDCTSIRELISRSLDGETTVKEGKILENHVRVCKVCKKYLEIQKIVMEKTKDAPIVSSDEIEERLEKIRPGRKMEKTTGWMVSPFLKPVFAGIVALLLASTILYVVGKNRVKPLSVARNDDQIIQALSEEERELLFFIEETSGGDEEDILEMLQELDEIEELFLEGRMET